MYVLFCLFCYFAHEVTKVAVKCLASLLQPYGKNKSCAEQGNTIFHGGITGISLCFLMIYFIRGK